MRKIERSSEHLADVPLLLPKETGKAVVGQTLIQQQGAAAAAAAAAIKASSRKVIIRFRLPSTDSSAASNVVVDKRQKEEKEASLSVPPPPPTERQWNLRPRYSPSCSLPMKTNKRRKEQTSTFSLTLTKEEIEADFMDITGAKPPRRANRRPKAIQNNIDCINPGFFLPKTIAHNRYR